jgi:hypothetical protein
MKVRNEGEKVIKTRKKFSVDFQRPFQLVNNNAIQNYWSRIKTDTPTTYFIFLF